MCYYLGNKGQVHYDVVSGTTKNEGTGALGGITGGSINSSVKQCFNTNTITAKYGNNYGMGNVGGIVGYNISSTIKNTYNIGSIYGNQNVGGIAGQANIVEGIEGKNYLSNNFNASEIVVGLKCVGNYAGMSKHTEGAYNSGITNQTAVGESGNNSYTNYETYTLQQMRTIGSGLLTLLSKGEGNGLWAQSSSINNGLPYLVNNRP